MNEYEDGIYLNMPETDYHKIMRLSASGIKNLLISPLDFYENFFNPEEKDVTDAMLLGKATHKLVLEGEDEFTKLYASELDKSQFPGYLDKGDELKAALKARSLKASGTKADMAERLRMDDPSIKLMDDIERQHLDYVSGRQVLSVKAFEDARATKAAIDAQGLSDAFKDGFAEVTILWTDTNGIKCKARLDYLQAKAIVDLKTIANSLGKDFDTCICHAIANYRYLIQAVFYNDAVEAIRKNNLNIIDDENADFTKIITDIKLTGAPAFVFVFTQTGRVKNCRARAVRQKGDNSDNSYWGAMNDGIKLGKRIYSEMLEKHGDKPWFENQYIVDLCDEDLPSWCFNI